MTTMNDIAKALGVSRPVVSSVFSHRETGTVRVSDKTRKRVLEIARELGYRPNQIARSVATGKTRVIAFVGAVVRFDFAMQTLGGVMSEAEQQGYTVKVMQPTDEGWSLQNVADTLLGRRVDGVICFHRDQNGWDQLLHELRGAIPVVALSCVGTMGGLVSVNSDNVEAYDQIIDHLLTLGHRRIAMIAGSTGVINERSGEFKQVMEQKGVPYEPWMVQRGDWSLATSEQVTRDMLSRPVHQRPTAICCATDEMAMATLRTARAMGFDVPGKLSVVGFGETLVAPMADPPLTSIDQSYHRMGELACEKLLDELEGRDTGLTYVDGRTPHLTVPTRLVVRASTAVVPTN